MYYTAKLTFSYGSPVKVWGVYCTSVRIVFEILRYLKRIVMKKSSVLQNVAAATRD